MFSTHFVLVILCLCSAIGLSFSLAIPETTNTTSTLARRQCIWSDMVDDFDCDDYLPSLNQLIKRMQDVNNDGRAIAENRAIFYANLFESPVTKGKAWAIWNHILAWMKSRGIASYYGAFHALDKDWEQQQATWIQSRPEMWTARYGEASTAIAYWNGCYNQGKISSDSATNSLTCTALSFAALHPEVYFFTKHDEDWAEDSVWETAEFGPLTREGGPVNEIYRVDPRPENEGGTPCAEPTVLWERGKDPARETKWKCPITEDHEPPQQP